MSSRKIMQTFMQTSAPTVATVPFYNTAEDIQKMIGYRTGTHAYSLVVTAQYKVYLLVTALSKPAALLWPKTLARPLSIYSLLISCKCRCRLVDINSLFVQCLPILRSCHTLGGIA